MLPPVIGALATTAALYGPFAALPDGGFLASGANYALLRVRRTGSVSNIIHPRAFGDRLAAATTGEIFLADSEGTINRLHLDGTVTRVAGGGSSGFFGTTDGERATSADLADTTAALAPTASDGLFVAGQGRVVWLAPRSTRRLAVAITRASLRLLTTGHVAVRTTVASTLTLVARRGRSRSTAVRARVGAGLSVVRLPQHLRSGEYELDVRARTRDGRQASTEHRFLLGPGLPLATAHRIAGTFASGHHGTLGCRRFGRRRVDCVVDEEACGSNVCFAACVVTALRHDRSGVISIRFYGRTDSACTRRWRRTFRVRPTTWLRSWHEAPPL